MNQNSALKYQFDFVDCECWLMDENVNIWFVTPNLQEDEVDVFEVEELSPSIKLGQYLLESRVYVSRKGTYCDLIL